MMTKRQPTKGALRKTKWRARHYAQGCHRLEIWAHPDDFEDIRKFAREKRQARGIEQVNT